jgi:hypothetical protein
LILEDMVLTQIFLISRYTRFFVEDMMLEDDLSRVQFLVVGDVRPASERELELTDDLMGPKSSWLISIDVLFKMPKDC